MREFYEFWRGWFAQPEADKLKLLRSPGMGGFYPIGSEAPGYGRPDPKEYFHYRTAHEGLNKATSKLFWDCYWKAKEWLDRRGLLPALDFQAGLCVLRILHYLPTPDGIAGEAHRDFDLLTVSVPGTCPGLEIWDEDEARGWDPGVVDGMPTMGTWKLQEEGIQVGEMLEIYTSRFPDAGRDSGLKCVQEFATTHRVRTAPNTERYKCVFFYLPPNDFELRPGFTAGDYLKDVLTRAGTISVGVKT